MPQTSNTNNYVVVLDIQPLIYGTTYPIIFVKLKLVTYIFKRKLKTHLCELAYRHLAAYTIVRAYE